MVLQRVHHVAIPVVMTVHIVHVVVLALTKVLLPITAVHAQVAVAAVIHPVEVVVLHVPVAAAAVVEVDLHARVEVDVNKDSVLPKFDLKEFNYEKTNNIRSSFP